MERSFIFVSRGRYEHMGQNVNKPLNTNKGSATTSVTANSEILRSLHVDQNYPNPFNPTTTIQFDLPKSERVKIVVYDMLGSAVRILLDEELPAGSHHVVWDGKNDNGITLASGWYICRFSTNSIVQSRKMIFLK